MANTTGGYVIFGVKDSKAADHDDRICRIRVSSELRADFGQKLRRIQPDIFFETVPAPILLPSNSGRCVFVAYVPASSRRPHQTLNDFVFWRRGEGGTAVQMNVTEVRDQMLVSEERLRKARLLRLEIQDCRLLVEELSTAGHQVRSVMHRFDTTAFKPLLADTCVLLPANDGLVGDLLRIPRFGAEINRWLDHASSPARSSHKEDIAADTSEIQKRLPGFHAECVACERRLDEILGRLT